jgi:cytochrome P450
MSAMAFLNADFKTTSLNIVRATYQLAIQPDIQTKLQNEIDEQWEDEEDNDYDVMNDMKYLDIFMREILPINNVIHRVFSRKCSQSTAVCGHHIEKG